MNNFSDIASAISDHLTLKLVKAKSSMSKPEMSSTGNMSGLGSNNCLQRILEKSQEHVEKIKEVEFDIFELQSMVNREEVLPIVAYNCLS